MIFWRRTRRTLKAKVSLAVRSTVICLLCLAMAGTSVVHSTSDAQLWVLADLSQSHYGQKSEMQRTIQEIRDALPQNYTMGVASFGASPIVESGLDSSQGFTQFQAQIDGTQTDIESALSFAGKLFAKDAAQHVVLISDGQQNAGDAAGLASRLKAQGIRVDVIQSEAEQSEDAQVSGIDLPDIVYENERFDIVVTIDANTAKIGTLHLYANRQLLGSESVNIQKGENTFVFEDVVKQAGMVTYEVLLQEDGGVTQNNKKAAVAKVVGTPSVLLLESTQGEAAELDKMLRAVSINTQVLSAQAMPGDMSELQKFAAVALVNVNAEDFSQAQLSVLETYVRTLGRSLVTFGGDNSYALGGYIGSPLEEMLPIDCDVRNELDMPSLGMVIVIDKSGSMLDGQYGLTKLELAKEAAARAAGMVTSKDQIGVIAFDDTAQWVVKLQYAQDSQQIQDDIGSIAAGGGTMMYSALKEAYEALEESDTKIKHVIILTDGQPGDSGFENIVEDMRKSGITLSGVAVGRDANSSLIEKLSMLGNGRFYQTDIFSNIPQIFAKETNLAMQSYIQNREFYPVFVDASPLTQAYPDGLPALTGFVASVVKPTATLALQSDNDMPVLAHWPYGAGQVVSWTSDVQGIWTENYLGWNQGAAFFAGLISQSLNDEQGQGSLTLREGDGVGEITLEGASGNDADTAATVVNPDGTQRQVSLKLTAPGKYTGSFDLEGDGAYAVKVEQRENGQLVNSLEGGLPVGYSAEFDLRAQDGGPLLAYLASNTGGTVLEKVSQIFDTPLPRVSSRWALSQGLLWAAFLLFLLDIALRRLQWEAAAQNAMHTVRTRIEAMWAKRTRQKNSRDERPLQEVQKQSDAKPDGKGEDKRSQTPDVASMSGELLANRRKHRE